jgi:glycosyltransferase involved in cell wall biosynthesis
MSKKFKLAYLVSHPIQYQAPLLRQLAQEQDIELKVFFCSDISIRPFKENEFGHEFKWDVPVLDGYPYEFLPSSGFFKPIARDGSTNLSFLRPLNYGLSKRLRAGNFDALWIHGWGYWTNIYAITVAKRLGIKVLMRGESHLHLPKRSGAKRFIKENFLRTFIANLDACLNIGSWNKDFYLHYGADPKKIFDVPYAVDNAFFQQKCSEAALNREALRASLQLQPGRPVILYASKMTERKRAQDLLEAYSGLSVNDAEPHPYLLFIGDGEMRATLEQRAANLGWNSIKFLGFKNQTELPQFYDLCDIFVLPSFHEPWGLVVNEVMNAGRAVVVSDQVGCGPDLVEPGQNGYVFKAGDIADLRIGLKTILSDHTVIEYMGKKSLEIINRWGFAQDIAGIRKSLESVVGS